MEKTYTLIDAKSLTDLQIETYQEWDWIAERMVGNDGMTADQIYAKVADYYANHGTSFAIPNQFIFDEGLNSLIEVGLIEEQEG